MSIPEAGLNLAKTDAEAEERALKHFENDPLPDVQPSLLSATEIAQYVERTGMVFPFSAGEDALKHASYAGGIGSKVFYYNSAGDRVQASLASGYLHIPHDSIVFVECDIRFRLPRYIAVRFNLHIKHVHRGLLLGTGPLVDPGFNGKLLIPIHNLTSEDYDIPRDEGLIWIEFTKTTYQESVGRLYGNFPPRKNIAEVGEWLDRIELSPRTGERVPIRSSIPMATQAVAADAASAAARANQASQSAEAARQASEEAAVSSNRTRDSARTIGAVVTIAVVLGGFALLASYLGVTLSQINSLNARVDQLRSSVSGLEDKAESSSSSAYSSSSSSTPPSSASDVSAGNFAASEEIGASSAVQSSNS